MDGRLADRRLSPADDHAPLTGPSLAAKRSRQVAGMSRRQLLRASIWGSIGVLATEFVGGSVAFLWGAAAAGASRVRIGTLDELIAHEPGPARRRRVPRLRRVGPRVRHDARPDPRLGAAAAIRPATGPRSTSGPCRRSARTSAAGRTRASRTSGSTVRATSRATTARGSSRRAASSARPTDRWTGSRSRSTRRAC